MISVIITSYKEEKTIRKAISSFLKQKVKERVEIIVMCGDNDTFNSAKYYSEKYKNVFVYRDEGKGKPAALNLAIKKAKGDILVLSDGDVFVDSKALHFILQPFEKKDVGAVSGHPVSLTSKNSMFGFWSYILTEVAHAQRLNAVKENKRIFCSGYLFAIRKKLFPYLPEELLSEDGFISCKVYEKGYKIAYAPDAKVYVKYPTNFRDWIKQKKRSVGGYLQIKKLTGVEFRSFKKELFGGFALFRYVSNIKELFWLLGLFIARVYLWILIYIEIGIQKKKHRDIWLRVESTK